jgi:formylglycine-generating enzyme required for sulfatase activity
MSCCPTSDRASDEAPATKIAGARRVADHAVKIPGGKAMVGTASQMIPLDCEGPIRHQRLASFLIGATTVTNAEFAELIKATGYVTEAERFGWSFVFWAQVPDSIPESEAVQNVEWWRKIHGATWAAPNGPGTEAACLPDHPVVQLSWNDAKAYADWVGGRLPTEAEWEHAARGGQGDVPFPWGMDEPDDTQILPCNIWQGVFPDRNTAADGYQATAPAKSYEPNPYGLYNMAGNVWEWTADHFRLRSMKKEIKARQAETKGQRLLKGGSFLCHKSYCYRYRIAARTGNTPDSTTTHQGFRVVWDL